MLFSLLLSAVTAQQVPDSQFADRAAILQTCYDNIDGQLEGDVARVAPTMHPQFVSRMVKAGATAAMETEVETYETIMDATRKGVLRTPRDQWQRTCEVLEIHKDIAVVRDELPDYVVYDVYAKFGGRWVIVNGMWSMKR